MTESPASLAAQAQAAAGHNAPVWSVSELSGALKRVVEGEFGHVRVRGEISGFKRAASGHCYMTMKDDQAVLDAVCWRGMAGRLSIQPEDGMEVIATGRLTTYPGRSKYQIVIESLELAGEGALLKLLEDRRKKLAAEGLFDAARKRELPWLPDVIGVVTSPTGAVIRDILHRLADRFPRRVLIWPVLVQGEGAAEQVAAAIEGFNRLPEDGPVPRPDVLIVARGGGSLEDLWSFNEEIVVRAAAASDIPLISAVGHETDTTLIDYASDRRAPTPTAAAEIAVPVRAELVADVLDRERRMVGAMSRRIEDLRRHIEATGRGLPRPSTLIETKAQQLDERADRMDVALRGFLRDRQGRLATAASGLRHGDLLRLYKQSCDRLDQLVTRMPALIERRLGDLRERLAGQAALLDSYSYERVLDRGFALVQDRGGAPITSAEQAAPGAGIAIRFRDGAVDATVDGPAGAGGGSAKPRAKASRSASRSASSSGAGPDTKTDAKTRPPKSKSPASDGEQGTLL